MRMLIAEQNRHGRTRETTHPQAYVRWLEKELSLIAGGLEKPVETGVPGAKTKACVVAGADTLV
jgi:hypothetical protein